MSWPISCRYPDLFLTIKQDFLALSVYLCESWTLHIFDGLELTGQFLSALAAQGSLLVFGQFLQSVAVVSQIHLSPDQQEGRPRAVVWNLWHPLWRDKVKEEWGMSSGRTGLKNNNTYQAQSHSKISLCWIKMTSTSGFLWCTVVCSMHAFRFSLKVVQYFTKLPSLSFKGLCAR